MFACRPRVPWKKVFIVFAIIAAGCGSAQAEVRFVSADPVAQEEFDQARALFEREQDEAAGQLFSAFIISHPEDPLRHGAELHLGRIAARGDDHAQAAVWFEQATLSNEEALANRARRELGASLLQTGDAERALRVLEPLAGRLDGPAAADLYSTLAEAARMANDMGLQIRYLDAHCRYAGRDACEGSREQIAQVVADTSNEETLTRLHSTLPQNGFGWALVVGRLTALANARGDSERVTELQAELERVAASGGAAVEELQPPEPAEDIDWTAVGALLPLSGRARLVGEQMRAGLELAAGADTVDEGGEGSSRLVVRDSGGTAESVVEAIDDLVQNERVAAIVGPADATTAVAAAERAQELGVPLLTLSIRSQLPAKGRFVLRAFQSNEAEVRALVTHAIQVQGNRSFAVLHPDTSYGRVLRRLIDQEVSRQNGSVEFAVSYPSTSTSFVQVCQELSDHQFDALIITDRSRRIELIAPALAAVGLWSRPPGESAPEEGRAIQLLLPANAFSQRLAGQPRQYLQGAVFAAVIWPGDQEAAVAGFVERYREAHGGVPSSFATQAHDAMQVIAAARAAARTQSRAALLDALLSLEAAPTAGRFEGFEESGEPTSPFRLLELEGSTFRHVGR